LKDEKKQYENGLPAANASLSLTNSTIWGKVPASQSLIYAFDADGGNRSSQDVGLDGLNDDEERNLTGIDAGFAALEDPAADNYKYF
jgi:cell surface protein SprA